MYTTIDAENTKYYRKAMDVVVSVESPAKIESGDTSHDIKCDFQSVWTNAVYGDTRYFSNMRVNDICKTVPVLMDLANGGFYNDGNAVPIRADDLKAGSGYGIVNDTTSRTYQAIVVTANNETSTGNSVPVGTKLNACARDSKGNKYYITKTIASSDTIESSGNYVWYIRKADLVGFPTAERLYIEYAFAGEVLRCANDELIDCTVNLRGVETKLADPELQMSEIEFNAYCPKTRAKLNRIVEGTVIKYTAGYVGDMSYPRTFYTNDKVTQDKRGVVNVTGYDGTMYYDKEFAGLTEIASSYHKLNAYNYPHLMRLFAMASAIENTNASLPTTQFNYTTPSSWSTTGTKDAFMLIQNGTLRSLIANMCNVFRAPNKCYLNQGIYVDYVDAGYPVLRVKTSQYDKSIYEKININLGNGADTITATMMSDYDESYDEIYKTYRLRNYWVAAVGQITETQTITLDANESKWVEMQNASRLWEVSAGKIEYYTPYKVLVKNDTSETQVITVTSRPLDYAYSSKSPYEGKKTGGHGIHAFPEIWASMEAWQDEAHTKHASFLTPALKNIAQRDPRSWTFTWRGDPRMQPRDRVTVAADITGTTQSLTIDTITLEHTDGGLTSQIVGRLGEV